MKFLNKKLIILVLLFFSQYSKANIFKNLAQTAIDYMSGKVQQGVEYIDKLWVNVEYNLYKPMKEAEVKFNSIKNNPMHLANYYMDNSFPTQAITLDMRQKTVKQILYLLEQKKIAFADENKLLHCFKKTAYTVGLQAADFNDLRDMINNQLIVSVAEVYDIVKPVLQKSYALINGKSLMDAIHGKEANIPFVDKAANFYKSFLWSKVCNNDQELINKLINNKTYEESLKQLLSAFEEQITKAKDAESKKAMEALLLQAKHIAVLHQAINMFVKINAMQEFLNVIDDATKSLAEVTPLFVEYKKQMMLYNKIESAQKKINQDQLFNFLEKDIQMFTELLEMRSVVVAYQIKDAFISKKLIDSAVKNQTVYKTNNTQVKTSLHVLCMLTKTLLKNIKTDFEQLPYINGKIVRLPFLGSQTIKKHFKAIDPENDYVNFAEELTVSLIQSHYENNTPSIILQQYEKNIIQYGKIVRLYNAVKKLIKLSTGSGTDKINSLLDLDQSIQDVYDKALQDKQTFDQNEVVKKLHLSSINLDTLLTNRGATFHSLKQNLNISHEGPWEAASTLVKAGEEAYNAYLEIIQAYKAVLNKANTFSYGRFKVKKLLSTHVHDVVTEVVNARKGNKEKTLGHLDQLYDEFVNYIESANFTDRARKIFKEMGSFYIKSIKDALKAQVIDAWYVHDIAWKMKNESTKGLGGTISEGLRKISPVSSKSVTLQVIS